MRRVLAATKGAERVVGALLLLGYAVLALALWRGKDFSENGALAFEQPAATPVQFLAAFTTPGRVQHDCFQTQSRYGTQVKIVSAVIKGRPLFACYDVDQGAQVKGVAVVDTDGFKVTNPRLLKPAGVWPHYAVIKSANEFVIGGLGLVVLMLFGFYAATRPKARVRARRWARQQHRGSAQTFLGGHTRLQTHQ
jgi:hypothetical protein